MERAPQTHVRFVNVPHLGTRVWILEDQAYGSGAGILVPLYSEEGLVGALNTGLIGREKIEEIHVAKAP